MLKAQTRNNKRKEKKEKKFIIEFNKKFDLIHDKTLRDNELIDDPGLFRPLKGDLNFNENYIEFSLSAHYARLKGVEIKNKIAWFTLSSNERLTIEEDVDQREMGEQVVIRVRASFKNNFLNLFSFNKKRFALTIQYKQVDDGKNCISTFIVPIPAVEGQTDWDSHLKFLGLHLPESIGGFQLNKLFLSQFHINEKTSREEKVLLGKLINYMEAHIDDRFENLNFLQMFQYMIAIEDLDAVKIMDDYRMERQTIFKYNEAPFPLQQRVRQNLRHVMCEDKINNLIKSTYILEVEKKLPLDVIQFDSVKVSDMLQYQECHDDIEELARLCIKGRITHIFGKLILFYVTRDRRRRDRNEIDTSRRQMVEFEPNRVTFRVTQRTLLTASCAKLNGFLSTFESNNVAPNSDDFYDFDWLNPELDDNEEQQIAVENIVNRTSFPAPFIIFGGPGTGKTSTIVEAIAQIVKQKQKAHILITASSNSTCDDIGNRLLKYVSINKILRLYSPSFDQKPEKIDSNLQKVSNFRDRILCKCSKRSCPELDNVQDPTYEEFYTARVVICTLISCGRLVSADISPHHFDYIFIDEAASENEPQAYIPISNLGITPERKINAQIVLSGDHKQLGPIVTNRFARKLGLEMSIMERLMKTDEKYQRHNNQYNNDYVVQLKKNFRNHPAIMHFSNDNFYNSQLISMCSDEIKQFALDPEILMFNSDFPILFHTTSSRSEEVGTSLKNEGELMVLCYYLDVILKNGLNGNAVTEQDIGIISPYRGQRDLMIEKLGDRPDLEIGTVDAFQGREKKIILMSCVRSGTKHIGFLRNEKRLNVSLTRAQALLIVIGNAETLQKCQIWNKFITYCYDNNAVVGDVRSVNRPAALDAALAEQEELPENDIEDEYEE